MHWKPSATGALLPKGAGRPRAGQKPGVLAVAVAVAAEVGCNVLEREQERSRW